MATSDHPFSSLNGQRWIYDVFLSSSGEQTVKIFTDHLHSSLTDAGIKIFTNGGEGEGEEFTSIKAINESQICLIVFSRNYAESRSCLDELVEIVKGSDGVSPPLILPVFYDVDPADLVEQFAKFELQFASGFERLEEWKAALTVAASFSGWDFDNFADRHEGKFIKKIVNHILKELSNTYLNVATHPIGIESRLQKLTSLLAIGTKKKSTLILGIYGEAGIGKTTLSKAIYNQFFHSFEGKSFLANIRENTQNSQIGLINLQKQLLIDILKKDKIKITSVEEGCETIKESLRKKRVLIILDDVDEIDQVKALCLKRDWFGLGSRIIITTRNMKLLEALEVEEICEVGDDFLLSEDEALELFCWHAFHKPYPFKEFVEYSKEIVAFSFGNSPLALKNLGSFLFGRDILEWKSAIEKWKKMPREEMLKM